jgi:hypothetical protein
MVGVLLEMFDLLFAVKHLPAVDAEHLSVGLGLYDLEFFDEFLPFG